MAGQRQQIQFVKEDWRLNVFDRNSPPDKTALSPKPSPPQAEYCTRSAITEAGISYATHIKESCNEHGKVPALP